MNGFNLSDIQDARLGGTQLSAIYLGYTKLWPRGPIDYSQEYLTIESLADNNTIRFNGYGTPEAKNIYWSSDKTTWNRVSSELITIKTLSNNEKIYIKGNNNSYAQNTWSGYTYFNSDAAFNISGNIMSLIYGDNFIGQTTLPSDCYNFLNIFSNSKVVDASNLILPATTLANFCYAYMFEGCTSLTAAPQLPATTLVIYCYDGMFNNCTSLTVAPELPATTLKEHCYYQMFRNCTSLTTAPELPATTVANSCYGHMFRGCTSLTTAPELPATTLDTACYLYMFDGCTSLNYIKMLATDISATDCLENWVSNVAPTGTFVKDYNLKNIPINSEDGIPTGWTIEEVNKPDYSKDYFTIEALESACEVHLQQVGPWENDYIISYSINGGVSWQQAAWGNSTTDLIVSLPLGGTLMIRGSNGHLAKDTSHYHKIYANKKIKVYGNISYLSSNSDTKISLDSDYYYAYLFYNCDKLVDASNLILPATTLSNYCYYYMFYGCTSLTTAPELPATTVANSCYGYMFRGCTSLTTAPELPATTLANFCYYDMFYNCTSLTTAPELPATTVANSCYESMLRGCTSLTTAPELPATTVANSCYGHMFRGCTSLTTAPELPATTLANSCYMSMFQDCTSLTTAPELPATTLANFCYYNMFRSCISLNYIKCLATDISASNSHTNWVNNVASTGTFVKPSSMTSWASGASGIPSGWTVTNV